MSRLPALGMAFGLALALGAASAPARAQMESREGIALENQILELRHELEQMRTQSYQGGGGVPAYQPPPVNEGGAGSGDINAQLLDRVTQLEDQVRQLRGRVDEIDNARQQAEQDLSKQIGDLQFKLNGGAAAAPAAGALSAPAARAAAVPPPPPPAAAHRTPEVALAAGNAALARHDYPAAEAAARDVLVAGRGPRAADAQYLLAQALAGQRNYPAAAVAYDDAYNRNARGYRAADSLLGLANSLTAIGDKKAACETLAKLHTQFPTVRADLRAPVAAARGRAACH